MSDANAANPAGAAAAPREVLGSGWWRLFAVELPIVAASTLYWLLAPETFLRDAFALHAEPASALLVWQYAASVASMVLWLYGRLLFAPTLHLPTFRLYQEALLVGDVGIVAVTAIGLAQGILPTMAFAALGMATLWGAIRGFWIWQTRPARS